MKPASQAEKLIDDFVKLAKSLMEPSAKLVEENAKLNQRIVEQEVDIQRLRDVLAAANVPVELEPRKRHALATTGKQEFLFDEE